MVLGSLSNCQLALGRSPSCVRMIGEKAATSAQRKEPLPDELREVGVTEHLDEKVPLDLEFLDEQGAPVKLQDFFGGDRPVALTLNYSNCPMLCSCTGWTGT